MWFAAFCGFIGRVVVGTVIALAVAGLFVALTLEFVIERISIL